MIEEDRSYPLPTESMPELRLCDHVADIVEMREFLESRGIETRNTRLDRYEKYLEQATRVDLIDGAKIFKNTSSIRFQSKHDWMLYVLREVHELMWILRGLKAHIPKEVDGKLRMIINGSDFAALDTNTESRNVQFELRIASYFCQTGCEVDLSTGTDVIATTEEHAFYLECKRIAGSNTLRSNLLKAKSQLIERMPNKRGKKKVYGIIAADVTKLAFAHNGLTLGLTNEHARDVVQEKLIGIAKSAASMPIFTGCSDLIDCWLQIHIPSVIVNPPTTTTRFSSLEIQNPRLDRKHRKVLKLFREITAIGSRRPDAREMRPKNLVLRKSLTLPAGTIYHFDQRLLEVFLEGSAEHSNAGAEVIAAISLDGVRHEFTALEFKMLAARISTSKRKKMAEDPDRTRAELVIELYLQRYPYENCEKW